MLLVLRILYNNIKEFDEQYRDHRHNFSPFAMAAIAAAYYIFVKHVGPKLMENRRPYELKNVLLVYNMAQVVINIYLGVVSISALIISGIYPRFTCMIPVRDNSELGLLELRLCYMYFYLKLVDYLDTVFFVLRKRYNQISFLHVYHHIMISVGTFMYLRYLPGGHGSMLGIINAYVHAIMYFYYFISALRPELKNSLWWKKYITQIQIAQFLILSVHFAVPLFDETCEYPKPALFFALVQNLYMAVLFSDFYYKAYISKSKRSAVVKGDTQNVSKVE